MPLVKAITTREPWCSALVDGHKPVENRRRGFPAHYRGPVILHASLTPSRRGAADARIHAAYGPMTPALFDRFAGGFGMALGHAELVDAHPDAGCCRPWGESEYEEDDGTRRGDLLHLVFEDAVRWEHPIPARGKLGLWTPSLELAAAALA